MRLTGRGRHREAALAAVAIQGSIRDPGLLRCARNDERAVNTFGAYGERKESFLFTLALSLLARRGRS